jgi:ABC-2 type transport system permease protein
VSTVAVRGPSAGAFAALRAEWVKVRTVRSTTWCVLALVGVSVLFSVLSSWESETYGGSSDQPGGEDIVLDSLAGIWFGQIAAAVLGVLTITSEYATQMIRSTLAAIPRRSTVLASKAAVLALIVLVAGTATSLACFFVGQTILRGNGFTYENGYPAETLRDGDTLRAVLGSGIYLTLLALFALGVGAVLRRTGGAITVVLALLLAPVIVISFLPEDLAEQAARFSLVGAGIAIQQTVESSETTDTIPLSPAAGIGVVATYAVVALALAFWLIRRRDA